MKVSFRPVLLAVLSNSLNVNQAAALPFWLNCFIFQRFITPNAPSEYNFECSSCGAGEWNGLFGGRFSTELECGIDFNEDGYVLDGDGTIEILGNRGAVKGDGGLTRNGGEYFSGSIEIGFILNVRDRTLEWTSCSVEPDDSCWEGCYCVYEGINFPAIPEFYCASSCDA